MAMFNQILGVMNDTNDNDLVFANFVDFDVAFDHRLDVSDYVSVLKAFDQRIPAALATFIRIISSSAPPTTTIT